MTSNSELRVIIKHITFMKMAQNLSKLSYDPKHQVGSVIVKNDWTEINSMGYNGTYTGSPNKRYSLETGQSKFIHAEMNAMIFSTLSRVEAKEYTVYVTLTPCEMCSRLLVQKGFKNVIGLKKYEHCGDSLEVFKTSNVNFTYIHDLIKDEYKKTDNLLDVLNIIYKYKDNMDIQLLDMELLECLKMQIGMFFEFDKSYLSNLPTTILGDIHINSMKEKIITHRYLSVFANTLYDLV